MANGDLMTLAADLRRLGQAAEPLAAKVVAKTAMDIEASAKASAPVDTGFLRNSIGTDLEKLEAVVGPTAHYGGYVEYGTSRTPPQPYMGPAVDEHEDRFVRAMLSIGADIL